MALSRVFKSAPLSVGRYSLIGRANIGVPEVHRARDYDGEMAAVYLFQGAGDDPAVMDRLRAAFGSAAALEHPNILRVLEWGQEGSAGYFVTEWVEGTTLARLLELHSRLPEANVVRFLAQVGQAMDFARKGNVALTRVTAENILIRSDGHAKVIPFELPVEEAAPVAAAAAPLKGWGKPQAPATYNPRREGSAPEVRRDRAVGQPVPFAEMMFDLGTTLHEALTGVAWKPPPPPPPLGRRRRTPQRPVGLTDRTERAIRRATDPDPARRPATCAEFIKMLRTRPVTAGTPKPDARPAGASGENRRGYVRYALGVGANCTINSSALDERPSQEIWPLVVQDVSLTGIGILLARRCEPGTILSVEVTCAGRAARSLPAQVVRVRKDNFGHWAHGCMFLSPLDEPQLHNLLEHLGRDTA